MTKNFVDDALEFFPTEGLTVKRTGRDQCVVLKGGLPYIYLQPSPNPTGPWSYTDLTCAPAVFDYKIISRFHAWQKRPRLPVGWDETVTDGMIMFMHVETKAVVFVPEKQTPEGKKALAELNAYLGS